MRSQKCFALKEGLDPLLDIYRANFNGVVEGIKSAHERHVEESGFPLVIAHTVAKGLARRLGTRGVSDSVDTGNL